MAQDSTQPPDATRFIETARGVLSYAPLALLLELLAFAEGRLLSIHPSPDFNGRVTRLFLGELLRRLELPAVELAPVSPASRTRFLEALHAADKLDWQPLTAFWQERFEAPS